MNAPALVVVCAGGHGRVLIEVLRRGGVTVDAWLDNTPALRGTLVNGVRIDDEDSAEILQRDPSTVRLVNALGNTARGGKSGLAARRGLYERFVARGFRFATVVSVDAVVAASATLGDGVQVITGAIVHPNTVIGIDTIVNTGAQIDHDCRIGSHAHIAPGAVLCGWVKVGDEAHVGAGAVVSDRVSIGDGAIVGAGSVVLRDVPAGATVVGNPARVIRAREA